MATNESVSDARVVVVGVVRLIGGCRAAESGGEASELLRSHGADVSAARSHRHDALVAGTVRIVVGGGRAILGAPGDLDLDRARVADETGGPPPDVAPRILHAEHLDAGGLVVGAPEHALGVHGAGRDGVARADPAVPCGDLEVGALEHHGEQVLDQENISDDLGVPDVLAVQLGGGDLLFSRCADLAGLSARKDSC